MDKSKLISIGTLSKLTGVHIKSLRYYDRLGILRPAYIDPASGYRYYSFPQIHVVDAIQLCVDLGIPLKQFTDFVGEDGRQIHYGALLARGTELAGAKIRSIQGAAPVPPPDRGGIRPRGRPPGERRLD